MASILHANEPIIIAHRGASGQLPEHTLAAATLAYALGADYIEQDIVLSKDSVPLVLHDIYLDTVSNVAEVFPERAREDGRWYAIDLTASEIKQLTVHERRDREGNQIFAKRYQGKTDFKIATLEEQLELIDNLNRAFNKEVGIYPEIKKPAWHIQQGQDISVIALDVLRKWGWDDADKAIFIQCFDFDELKRIDQELGAKAKLIQLIGPNSWQESDTDYDFLIRDEGLKQISEIAEGIGPWIPMLYDLKNNQSTGLTERAHAHHLQVHPYTFRIEELEEMTAEQLFTILFKDLKVDGVFTDFTNETRAFLGK